LRRRFRSATFFFNLPDDTERKVIWKIYMRKYKLDKQPLPDDAQWTGAEIEQAASLAWQLKISLVDAAAYIVPVAISDARRINALRENASGKFISASYSGVYDKDRNTTAKTGRKLELA